VITFIAALLLVGVAFCFSVYMAFAIGYVASCIWAWFLMPIGLPSIHWKVFAAVLLLIGLFRQSPTQSSEKLSGMDAMAPMFALAVAPWFVLLVAWFIHN